MVSLSYDFFGYRRTGNGCDESRQDDDAIDLHGDMLCDNVLLCCMPCGVHREYQPIERSLYQIRNETGVHYYNPLA